MNIFNWLKRLTHATPVARQQRLDLDWEKLEQALAYAIVSEVDSFSKEHPEETFYGFALDCNAYYANVLFCLNTPEDLEESAREYSEEDTPSEIERQKADLEWSLGDWKYQGFNLDSSTWKGMEPFLEEFAELSNEEDTEKFLLTCCRALLSAETNGAFLPLRRTPDFRVACIDHDEDLGAGDRRLERVRLSS